VTVQELIKKLEEFPPDTHVMVSDGYGDPSYTIEFITERETIAFIDEDAGDTIIISGVQE
jgi:hypothetical protein